MGFMISIASEQDIEAIVQLIGQVYEGMAQKEWYASDNGEYTRHILQSGQGLAYLAREEGTGRLAGVFMTAFPGSSQENLGRDIGLPEEELPLVAHMDSAAVLPAYRGHRLQQALMERAQEDLTAQGFRYLMCTVHPDNRPSKDNVLAQGYQVAVTKRKYGGYLRDILWKKIGTTR